MSRNCVGLNKNEKEKSSYGTKVIESIINFEFKIDVTKII